MDYIEVTINKPLFTYEGRYFVNIRDKYIKQAKRSGKYLKINIPAGTAYYTWQEWMTGAKELKQEFKFKGDPMILYGNYITPGYGEPTMDNYLENMSKLAKMFRKIYGKTNQRQVRAVA